MKTDTIFYSLFQAFPSIFFELINHSPTEAGTYEFTSREVKQLAFRLEANSGFTKRAISGIRESLVPMLCVGMQLRCSASIIGGRTSKMAFPVWRLGTRERENNALYRHPQQV